MKVVVLSIPETNCQQPCEGKKDVFKNFSLQVEKSRQRVNLPKARSLPGHWQEKLELGAFQPPTFLLKYHVLENLQDEFQK